MTGAATWMARAMVVPRLFILLLLPVGVLGGWAVGVATWGAPEVTVENLHEADGVAVRGGQIDLVGTKLKANTCPGTTQRYLWRDVDVDGRRTTQIVPLAATTLPSYVPPGPSMISLPVPSTVTDGKWFYRAVTVENCSWIPAWLGGPRVRRTDDVPVEIKG